MSIKDSLSKVGGINTCKSHWKQLIQIYNHGYAATEAHDDFNCHIRL